MAADDQRKTRSEKKDGSPPKGRKKLDFTKSASLANQKPLKGKTIYLDLKNFRGVRGVEVDLKLLGANVVSFFSKDIHYVITSQGLPRDYKDDSDASGNIPSPSVSTPSPFNLGYGRGVNSPQNDSSGMSNSKKNSVPIRGKSIVDKAKVSMYRGSSDLLRNAKTWNVRIVHVDTALMWIKKEKEKLPKEQMIQPKPSSSRGKLPVSLSKSVKCHKLKGPFLKFETTNRHYRPLYKQLHHWPRFDVHTSRGTCPFDGMSYYGGVQAERAEREEREERHRSGDQEDAGDKGSDGDKPKRDSSRPQKHSDSVDFLDTSHIKTAGEIRRLREAKRKAEQKQGFCELCDIRYKDIEKHVQIVQHRENALDNKHYKKLDLMVANGPDLVSFVGDLIASNKREQKQSKTRPSSSAGAPDVQTSSPKSSKSTKSPRIAKKCTRQSPRWSSSKRKSPCRGTKIKNKSKSPRSGNLESPLRRKTRRISPGKSDEAAASSKPIEHAESDTEVSNSDTIIEGNEVMIAYGLDSQSTEIVSEIGNDSDPNEENDTGTKSVDKSSQNKNEKCTGESPKSRKTENEKVSKYSPDTDRNGRKKLTESAPKTAGKSPKTPSSRKKSRKQGVRHSPRFEVDWFAPERANLKQESVDGVGLKNETSAAVGGRNESQGVQDSPGRRWKYSQTSNEARAPVCRRAKISLQESPNGRRKSLRTVSSGEPAPVDETAKCDQDILDSPGSRRKSLRNSDALNCVSNLAIKEQKPVDTENIDSKADARKVDSPHSKISEEISSKRKRRNSSSPSKVTRLRSRTLSGTHSSANATDLTMSGSVAHNETEDLVSPRRGRSALKLHSVPVPALSLPPQSLICPGTIAATSFGMVEISSPTQNRKLGLRSEHCPNSAIEVSSPTSSVFKTPSKWVLASPRSRTVSPSATQDSCVLVSPQTSEISRAKNKQESSRSPGVNVLLRASPCHGCRVLTSVENIDPNDDSSFRVSAQRAITSPGRIIMDRMKQNRSEIPEHLRRDYQSLAVRVRSDTESEGTMSDYELLQDSSPCAKQVAERGRLRFLGLDTSIESDTDVENHTPGVSVPERRTRLSDVNSKLNEKNDLCTGFETSGALGKNTEIEGALTLPRLRSQSPLAHAVLLHEKDAPTHSEKDRMPVRSPKLAHKPERSKSCSRLQSPSKSPMLQIDTTDDTKQNRRSVISAKSPGKTALGSQEMLRVRSQSPVKGCMSQKDKQDVLLENNLHKTRAKSPRKEAELRPCVSSQNDTKNVEKERPPGISEQLSGKTVDLGIPTMLRLRSQSPSQGPLLKMDHRNIEMSSTSIISEQLPSKTPDLGSPPMPRLRSQSPVLRPILQNNAQNIKDGTTEVTLELRELGSPIMPQLGSPLMPRLRSQSPVGGQIQSGIEKNRLPVLSAKSPRKADLNSPIKMPLLSPKIPEFSAELPDLGSGQQSPSLPRLRSQSPIPGAISQKDPRSNLKHEETVAELPNHTAADLKCPVTPKTRKKSEPTRTKLAGKSENPSHGSAKSVDAAPNEIPHTDLKGWKKTPQNAICKGSVYETECRTTRNRSNSMKSSEVHVVVAEIEPRRRRTRSHVDTDSTLLVAESCVLPKTSTRSGHSRGDEKDQGSTDEEFLPRKSTRAGHSVQVEKNQSSVQDLPKTLGREVEKENAEVEKTSAERSQPAENTKRCLHGHGKQTTSSEVQILEDRFGRRTQEDKVVEQLEKDLSAEKTRSLERNDKESAHARSEGKKSKAQRSVENFGEVTHLDENKAANEVAVRRTRSRSVDAAKNDEFVRTCRNSPRLSERPALIKSAKKLVAKAKRESLHRRAIDASTDLHFEPRRTRRTSYQAENISDKSPAASSRKVDEEFPKDDIAENKLSKFELKGMVENVASDSSSNWEEAFGAVPARITRKFFMDISSGLYESASSPAKSCSEREAASLQSVTKKLLGDESEKGNSGKGPKRLQDPNSSVELLSRELGKSKDSSCRKQEKKMKMSLDVSQTSKFSSSGTRSSQVDLVESSPAKYTRAKRESVSEKKKETETATVSKKKRIKLKRDKFPRKSLRNSATEHSSSQSICAKDLQEVENKKSEKKSRRIGLEESDERESTVLSEVKELGITRRRTRSESLAETEKSRGVAKMPDAPAPNRSEKHTVEFSTESEVETKRSKKRRKRRKSQKTVKVLSNRSISQLFSDEDQLSFHGFDDPENHDVPSDWSYEEVVEAVSDKSGVSANSSKDCKDNRGLFELNNNWASDSEADVLGKIEINVNEENCSSASEWDDGVDKFLLKTCSTPLTKNFENGELKNFDKNFAVETLVPGDLGNVEVTSHRRSPRKVPKGRKELQELGTLSPAPSPKKRRSNISLLTEEGDNLRILHSEKFEGIVAEKFEARPLDRGSEREVKLEMPKKAVAVRASPRKRPRTDLCKNENEARESCSTAKKRKWGNKRGKDDCSSSVEKPSRKKRLRLDRGKILPNVSEGDTAVCESFEDASQALNVPEVIPEVLNMDGTAEGSLSDPNGITRNSVMSDGQERPGILRKSLDNRVQRALTKLRDAVDPREIDTVGSNSAVRAENPSETPEEKGEVQTSAHSKGQDLPVLPFEIDILQPVSRVNEKTLNSGKFAEADIELVDRISQETCTKAGVIDHPVVGSRLRLKRKRRSHSQGSNSQHSDSIPCPESETKRPNTIHNENTSFSVPSSELSSDFVKGRDEIDGVKNVGIAPTTRDAIAQIVAVDGGLLKVTLKKCDASMDPNRAVDQRAVKGAKIDVDRTSEMQDVGAKNPGNAKATSGKAWKSFSSQRHLPFENLKHISAGKIPSEDSVAKPRKKLLKSLSDRPKSYRLGMDILYTMKSGNNKETKCGCSNDHGAKKCAKKPATKQDVHVSNRVVHKPGASSRTSEKLTVRNSPKRAAALVAKASISSPQKTVYGSLKKTPDGSPSKFKSAHSSRKKMLGAVAASPRTAKSKLANSREIAGRLSRSTVASSAKARTKVAATAKKAKVKSAKKKLAASFGSGKKESSKGRTVEMSFEFEDE